MSKLIALLALVGAIWVIYDVWAVNKSLSSGAKILWTVCAVFFSLITAIVYYLVGRKA